MRKNLLYLLLLIGLTVSAKSLPVSDSNFETKFKKGNLDLATTVVNSCLLNVEIGFTLDMPTSTYFVNEIALNGTAPYTYFLDGELSPNGYVFYAETLNPGIHTVTVQDINGCSGSGTFEVLTSPLSITTTVKNPTCIESGSFTCATIGGVGPYTYSISFNGGPFSAVSSPSYDTFTFGPSLGIYQIQITDAGGNTSSTIVELISPIPPSVVATHTDVSCHGDSNGTITVTAANGIAPYQYSIDNGVTYQSSNYFTGLNDAGVYSIVVKDAKDCTSVALPADITQPLALSASISVTTPLSCGLGNVSQPAVVTVTVDPTTGTAPYEYSFNGGTYTSANTYTTNVDGLVTAMVRDANNCIIASAVSTTVAPLNPPTDMIINGTPVWCRPFANTFSTVTLNVVSGVGPLSYSILSPGNAIGNLTGSTSGIFTGLEPDIYVFQVSDANGCIYVELYTVAPATNITVAGQLIRDVSCNPGSDGEVLFTVSNFTGTYSYSINGAPAITGQSTPTITISGLSAASLQTIVIKDEVTGCTATASVTVSIPTPLALSVNPFMNANCNDGAQISVTASGGSGSYTYAYVVSGSEAPTAGLYLTSSSAVLDYNISAIWDVYVKDSNGCTTKTSVTISEPTALAATATITKSLDCISGATVVCAATGGSGFYTYSFDNGANYSSTSTFTSSIAGPITVFVRDATFGCVANTVIDIEPLSPLSPTITATNITCNGLNDGRITIIAKGGSAPYTFSIDNGVTFTSYPEFNNLSAGTYDVIVKDANGCTYTYTEIIITEPEPITANVSVENQAIIITATGGSGGYTYSFGGGGFQSVNLYSIGNNYGSYQIYVKDSNGCAFSIDVTVNPPAPLLNGEKTLAIQFTSGQTLEDIIVDGQGIKWYSKPGTSNNKSQAPEPTLPLSTVLVDNTTYYASQTINGYESKERLAVTTKLSLSTADYALPNFKFYPNPVKNSLTISNTAVIDEVVFISTKGDVVLTKQINSTEAAIDLSGFSKGLYFLKIKAEGTEKTIKLIKE